MWSRLGLMEAYRGAGDYPSALTLLNGIAAQIGALATVQEGASAGDRYAYAACALADALAVRSGRNPHYLIASLYAQCGSFANAADWLETSHAGGESPILFYHSDPRFSAFKNSDEARGLDLTPQKRPTKPTG